MKLRDLFEKKETKGTYAGVCFNDETTQAIKKYISDNNIPNGVPVDKLHTTLLYSRKFLPDYVPQGDIDPPFTGTVTGLTVWLTQDKKSRCLIMKYDCPELTERHKFLMETHGATFDYDSYKTHVTLSYDIGDLDHKKLPDVAAEIPEITIVKEYSEVLDLNWAKNSS